MEARIARELGLKKSQVASTLALLDDKNTVPFIARYRKEATGGLDEVQIRDVAQTSTRLRALESREIKPVGSNATVKTDARIVAATNRNLIHEVRQGNFREDLYYLSLIHI